MSQNAAANQGADVLTTIEMLQMLQQRSGDKPIRMIVTIRHAGDIAAAQQRVIAALDKKGVHATPIEGVPMIVTECQPRQLEDIASLITHVQQDQLDTTQ
ncbi:hypothetical protein [Rhodanobacter lindaniclasticus]